MVNDFPDNYDILRPALRAISNLLSKEMIQQIDVVSLLDTACRVLNRYAGRKKFVLEIMELICNLAKSLTSYTTIRVKDILDPMVAVMKRFRGNVEIIVKTLLVIEMMIPADPEGEQLKEATLLKVVVGVSDLYEQNGEVQAAVYRTICAMLHIPAYFRWMVQHMDRLMACMDRFNQKKEVQTVCVRVLTRLCDDQDVLESMDDAVLKALDTLLVRFPYDEELNLATVRCIRRLLSVPELCEAFVKMEGAAHIFATLKTFKNLELLEVSLQIVDLLLHKNELYVQKLLVEHCGALLATIGACDEKPSLLTFVAKLLSNVSHEVHDKLVAFVDEISATSCKFAQNKEVVKYLFALLAEIATDGDMSLLQRMQDKGVTRATIEAVAANTSSKSLIKSATSLMAALVSNAEAAEVFASGETIVMLNDICKQNLKKPEVALNVISVLIKLAENEACATVMSENNIIQTTAQTLNLCSDSE